MPAPGLEELAAEIGYADCKDISGFIACAVAAVAAEKGRARMEEDDFNQLVETLCDEEGELHTKGEFVPAQFFAARRLE